MIQAQNMAMTDTYSASRLYMPAVQSTDKVLISHGLKVCCKHVALLKPTDILLPICSHFVGLACVTY